MAQTVGTCGLRSCDSELRCLQAFAQISLVFPTALSPTRTHLTNSWLVLSSSMLLAYCDFTEVFSVFFVCLFCNVKVSSSSFFVCLFKAKTWLLWGFSELWSRFRNKKSMWAMVVILNCGPMVVCFKDCFDPLWENGILLQKLFWPTVRKKCYSDRENFLKFKAEGREFEKFWDN